VFSLRRSNGAIIKRYVFRGSNMNLLYEFSSYPSKGARLYFPGTCLHRAWNYIALGKQNYFALVPTHSRTYNVSLLKRIILYSNFFAIIVFRECRA
jgi:hypothetical protein